MNFITSLFSSKSIENTIDAIIDTGDALVFTDEEKQKAHQKGVETKLKMLKQFEAFRLAQRLIAVSFTINFILAFWIAVVIDSLGTKEDLESYLKIVATFELGWIMLTIIAWYFTGGFIKSKETNKT